MLTIKAYSTVYTQHIVLHITQSHAEYFTCQYVTWTEQHSTAESYFEHFNYAYQLNAAREWDRNPHRKERRIGKVHGSER